MSFSALWLAASKRSVASGVLRWAASSAATSGASSRSAPAWSPCMLSTCG